LLEDERIGAVERKLVACLLSRWLSGLTDERLSSLHMLVRALRLWGLTAVYVDGELAPVRCQGITSWPVPSPQSAMVRVGLTRTDIDEQWREAEQRHGVRALGTCAARNADTRRPDGRGAPRAHAPAHAPGVALVADNASRRYGAGLMELRETLARMSPRQLRAAGPIALKNLVILTLFLRAAGLVRCRACGAATSSWIASCATAQRRP